MTTAFSPVCVAAALAAAEEYTDGNRNWSGVASDQQFMLSMLPSYQEAVRAYYAKQVQGFARQTAEELNRILADNGFDIQLSPWPPLPGSFGVAGISDIAVSWKLAGEPTPIWTDSRGTFPGFELDAEANGRLVTLKGLPEADEVIELTTADGMRVRIVMSEALADWRSLTVAARALWTAPVAKDRWVDSFQLPMVSLDVQPDISWMVGVGNGAFTIQQAEAQSKFGMNQFGARAKEAVAFGLECARPSFAVNRPFLITIGRPEASVPGFQAYITEEHWTDPGDLSSM